VSTQDGGLSPREHDELRDLVLAGTQRIRPAGAYRAQLVAAGVALVLVGAVTGGILTATLGSDDAPAPVTTPAPSPSPSPPVSAGRWVAFSSSYFEGDIYLVRHGSAPHRVLGSDDDDLDQVCPAFSADASRIASGQATGNEESGWQDAAVVITEVTGQGEAGSSEVIPLDGLRQPPCPIWSPDGRWVAFGAQTSTSTLPAVAREVWLVSVESGEVRSLTGLAATDIEWAPDSADLYIADSDGILVHSIADDQTRTLADTAGTVALTMSPDGNTLAVERRNALWLMTPDGGDRQVLVEDYTHERGIGPVWSPYGDRIVFQRTGDTTVTHGPGQYPILGENEEVVVVTVGDDDPLGPFGTQTVLSPVESVESGEPRRWLPTAVSWSSDSSALRFLGWELLASGEMGGGNGLLTVPVDRNVAPTILWETAEGIGTMSIVVPLNDFQAWSRG
jgi:hypothetical protein